MASNKYDAPPGPPPPSYVQHPAQTYEGSANQYYQGAENRGQPYPQQGYQQPQQYPQQGYAPQGYQQGPYQQQPMAYQQQPMYAPQGGYYDQRQSGAGTGMCEGLLAGLACCCCLDFCIF